MKGLEHVFELHDLRRRLRPRTITNVRSKERDRIVSPVIAKPPVAKERIVDEPLNREQFQGGDSELAEIADDGFAREAEVGAAELGWNVGVAKAETLGVRFVDDRAPQRDVGWHVVLPIERRIDDDPERCAALVDSGWGKVLALIEDVVGKGSFREVLDAGERAGIGIQEQVRGIEAEPFLWLPRPVDAVAVQLTWHDRLYVDVPYELGAVPQTNSRFATLSVEEAELYAGRGFRIDREVRPSP